MVTGTVLTREETIVVGIGEIKVAQFPVPVLACIGLGSCVAVCAYDYTTKIGGIAHVVLPSSSGREVVGIPKYADIAVPRLISEIVQKGGFISRIAVKIAGGAQMSFAPGIKDAFKTGERNVEGVVNALERLNVSIAAAETGGNKGRTVHMYLETGKITVRSTGGDNRQL